MQSLMERNNQSDENPYLGMRLPQLLDAKRRVEVELSAVKTIATQIELAVQDRVAPAIGEARNLMQKESGTIAVVVDGVEVKSVVSETVSWDTAILDEVCGELELEGKNPADWVDYKLSISAAKYKKLSKDMRRAFDKARTTKYSAPKNTMTEVDQ